VYSLAGFERFCQGLPLKDGSPLVLEPFQKRILRDHFAGVVEEVVVVPKKNGKTTLFAALALYHLTAWPKADVVVVASSAEQAGILFEQAADMVESSALADSLEVRGRFGGAYRQIRRVDDASARIRVIAADAKTADGVLPTLALVDELHRHPNGELYGVLSDGIDARSGRMVTISTAGLDEASPLGQIRTRAEGFGSYRRRGAYCHARSDDGAFVLHEWSLADDDDRDDLRVVKRANPLKRLTVAELARRKNSPLMTPARWARYACGVWGVPDDAWLEAKDWDSLAVDIGGVVEGEEIWVAVDAGTNPGVAYAARRDNDAVAVRTEIGDGEVPLAFIEQRLIALAESFDVKEIVWGSEEFRRSAEILEARGLPVAWHPYRAQRLSAFSSVLLETIREGRLRHDGDPVLRSQVLGAVAKETEVGGWRLLRSPQSRGVIAMAVAVHQATQVVTPPRRPRIYSLSEVS
jgi:phage terminase large subunit-like protein